MYKRQYIVHDLLYVCRVLAIRMALVLRKANHGRLDIQGYTVLEHAKRKEEQMKKREAKRKRLNQAYGATPPAGTQGTAAVVGDVLVHYNTTSNGGMGGVRMQAEQEDICKDRHMPVHSVSVEITPS